MTELDDVMLPLASDLIAQFGKSVSWRKYTRVTNQTNGVTTTTYVDYTVVVTPPSAADPGMFAGSDEMRPSDTTRVGSLSVGVAARGLAFVPTPDDEVTIDGLVWTCVGVSPTYSGASIALYTCSLRITR